MPDNSTARARLTARVVAWSVRPVVLVPRLAPAIAWSSLLAAWLLPLPAGAQVNIERLRSGTQEPGLSGALGAALELKHGNVDLLAIDGNAAARYQVDRGHGLLLSGKGGYGEVDDERTAATAFGHLRWTAMWWGWAGSEVFTQLEYDQFVRLNLRALVGAGPRFALVEQDELTLYTGTAYMLERERLDIPESDSHPRATLVHRSSSYLALTLELAPHLRLVHTVYVQPRFDRPKDIRVLDELSLRVSLVGQLELTVGLGLRFDSDPPDEVERVDLHLRNGLSLTL